MIIFRVLLLAGVLSFGNKTSAQELVGTTGFYSPTAIGSMSWSIGEIVTETYTTTTGYLTTGYQQTYGGNLSVNNLEAPKVSVTIFPNPFKNNTSIKVENLSGDFLVTIVDCQSKIVLKETFYLELNTRKDISLSNLLKGYYFINIHHLNSNTTITQPIIKIL